MRTESFGTESTTSSTDPGLDPDDLPEYGQFETLSRTRGVDRNMDLK
jgi:hypothetical protein